jgi:hypothetical protein
MMAAPLSIACTGLATVGTSMRRLTAGNVSHHHRTHFISVKITHTSIQPIVRSWTNSPQGGIGPWKTMEPKPTAAISDAVGAWARRL